MPDPKLWGLPLFIFTLALGLRLLGIGWGLPNANHQQSFHPDEPVVWAYSQGIEPTKLKFTPGFYNYGTLYLTTLKVASDVVAGYSGGGVNPEKLDEVWSFIGKSHLAGRVISALAGSGTALLVFLILRRFSNELGAAFGGLAIAFAPAHVVHSRFQTVDILAAFLIAASAFYALKLIPTEGIEEKRSDIKLAILSGAFAGLSAGTKYTGILCLITLVVVAFGVRRQSWLKLSGVGIGIAALVFLVTTPGILLETGAFMKGFLYETKHVKEGHGLIFEGTSSGFIFHIANLMLGLGTLMALLGLGGLFGGAGKRHWWAIGLAAFLIPYYVLIAGAEVKFIRYTFPLFIGIAVGFGWLIGKSREKGGKWHMVVGLGILALGGLLGGGLQSSIRFTAWMASPDPREVAGAYLRGKDTTVGVVADPWFYTASFHPDLGRRLVFEQGMPAVGMTGYSTYLDSKLQATASPKVERFAPIGADGQRDLAQRLDWDERLVTESKPEYVAFSSFESEGLERIAKLSDPSPVGKATSDRAKAFMEKLKAEYVFDRQFGPDIDFIHDMLYVQPTVWVWKRKTP